MDFQNGSSFDRLVCFYTSSVFNTLTLKQIFWKTKNFFRKLEYRFLVENIKIENAQTPYKTPRSEVNVKNGEYKMDLASFSQ